MIENDRKNHRGFLCRQGVEEYRISSIDLPNFKLISPNINAAENKH